MAGSESRVDVKPSATDIWRATLVEEKTNQKCKFEVESLMRNQVCLLDIVTKLVELGDKERKDVMTEIHYLCKYAPSTSPLDSFRPT